MKTTIKCLLHFCIVFKMLSILMVRPDGIQMMYIFNTRLLLMRDIHSKEQNLTSGGKEYWLPAE